MAGGEAVNESGMRVEHFPGPQHSPLAPGSEQRVIDAAQSERATLQAMYPDLIIPDARYEVTTTDSERPQITVHAPVVEAEPFTPGWDWPAAGAAAPHQDKAARLAMTLDGYYHYVLGAQPELFLGGIADVRAWAVTRAGQLALLGASPLMIDGQGPQGRLNVASQYALLKEWVGNIQPRDDLGNSQLRLRIWGVLDSLSQHE